MNMPSCHNKKESKVSSSEKITMGCTLNAINSMVWIAKEKGFFDNQGLDVTLKQYASGKRAEKCFTGKTAI